MKKWINKFCDKMNEIINKIKNIKIDFKSLRFKLWAYFSMFAIFIFIILWFMQVIFLQNYYTTMKKNEVRKTAEKIEDKYDSKELIDTINRIAYKDMFSISLLDNIGNVLYNSELQNKDPITTHTNIYIDSSEVISEMLQSNQKSVEYTTKITKFNSQIFIYCKEINDGNNYILLATPIDPINSTTSVLANQLKYITIISLICSFIVSIFLSNKLTKPISKMAKSAQKLKDGDYNVMFERGYYTEIDNLASTLNSATNELGKTDTLRKELIANVSHDLRTPLTMIKAYAEMIRDLSGNDEEKRNEHLKVIIDETNRLTRLINDMMDLSKLESGVITIKKNDFDIIETIAILLKNFEMIYEKDGYTFKFDYENPIYVYGDETKIEQVIYNLINNAVNYSDDDKRIIIKLIQDKKNVKVQIIDHGRGISKEKLPYIWDRYYKIGEIHKTAKTGTGLGLSIVKNILEKHGQKYGVESQENVGSTFWFDLELSKDMNRKENDKK